MLTKPLMNSRAIRWGAALGLLLWTMIIGATLGHAQNLAPLGNFRNVLIGGDFSTNPYQRGTASVTGITNTATYGPDRWFGAGAAGSSITLARTATSATLAGVSQAMSLQRAAANADVTKICAGQIIETAVAQQFQGQTMTLSWFGQAGANLSAASAVMQAIVTTGTGTNQAASNLLAATWTGQADATSATTYVLTSTGFQRYQVTFTVPSSETQMAVRLCFTPVGTAGTTDSIIIADAQLEATPGCSANCATPFENRSPAVELALAQRYTYVLTEVTAISPIAPCAAIDVTHTNCIVQFPVPMRTTPTGVFANGFATPTSTTQATLGACTTLAAATTVASTVGNVLDFLVNCTAGTVPAAGVASFLYSNAGTGKMTFSAEF